MNPNETVEPNTNLLQVVELLDDQASMIRNFMGIPFGHMNPMNLHQLLGQLHDKNREVVEVLLQAPEGAQDAGDKPAEKPELGIPGL